MSEEDFIEYATESLNGTITAFVSDYHRCRNKQDVDPKDFVKCVPVYKYDKNGKRLDD